jgi:hypothetical protein
MVVASVSQLISSIVFMLAESCRVIFWATGPMFHGVAIQGLPTA